jgi:hypothetical protein
LTFGAVTRTLPIVIYSHFRMLVSLLIVVTLALVFLWGGSRVLNAVTEATPPAPSATPQPAIERPTVVPVTRSTKAARGGHTRPVARPRPVHKPAAHRPPPTATANTAPSVLVTASASPASPATVFPLGLQRLYCWVRNSALPPGAVSITFNWTRDQANGFLYQFSLARQRNAYTGGYFYVPQVAGKYRCDIIVNGQPFGSAHFSRAP